MMLSVLRRRDFALVWSGGLISDLGDWLLMIGLPVFVFQLTGSAAATALTFLVELLPSLMLGSFAGVLIDRWDRRRTMVAVNAVQAVLLLPLLAVDGPDKLWLVYAVAGLETTLALLFNPAKNALLPTLVEPSQLTTANALVAINDNAARLVGAPLGGLMVDTLGLTGIVLVDACSFVVAAALVALVRTRPATPAASPTRSQQVPLSPEETVAAAGEASAGKASLRRDWTEGLRVLWQTASLRRLLLIGGLASVAQGMFVVLFVVFIQRELGGGGSEVGLVRGVQAVGGILGGLLVAGPGRRLAPVRLLGWGAFLNGVVSLAIWNASALTTQIAVYAGLFIVAGLPLAGYGTGLMTVMQTSVDNALLGRVTSTLMTVGGALQAAGTALAGALGDRLGVVPLLDGQAGLWLLAGLLSLLLLRVDRNRGRGPDGADPESRQETRQETLHETPWTTPKGDRQGSAVSVPDAHVDVSAPTTSTATS
jgi:Na+/melibiose symporter-like transporter